MEQNLRCANCGAEILPQTSFCRQCGTRANLAAPPSVAEDTTRPLAMPVRPSPFFGPELNMPPPGPLTPPVASQPPAPIPAPLSNSKAPSRLAAFIIGFVFLGIALTGAFLLGGKLLGGRRHPPLAPTGPIVPPPPPPPGAPGALGFSSELIYPGAKTTMEVNKQDSGKAVAQFSTPDSFDKVSEWYMQNLKPDKVIRLPGTSVILESQNVKIIITAQGPEGTTVLLTRGG